MTVQAHLDCCALVTEQTSTDLVKKGGKTLPSDPPRLEELNHFHETLSAEERDELLQCLLIAAPRGERRW